MNLVLSEGAIGSDLSLDLRYVKNETDYEFESGENGRIERLGAEPAG